jgi:hypothetical protein
MRDLTLGDDLQAQLVSYLAETESLLSKVASELSGRHRDAQITALPDLGLPHNVGRILGGFLTGALYEWETDVPFVPVDATVNVCGVSVFRLKNGFEDAVEFQNAIGRAEQLIADSSFVWNYAEGNHFISWSQAREGEGGPFVDGDYLVLHASPAEFKSQFNGLYPTPGNWYWSDVRTIADRSTRGERSLRVLTGDKAERFVRWAHLLEALYHERQEFVASLVAPGSSVEPVLSVLHYGMPTATSVAIGCQWLPPDASKYLLLTRPGAPFFLVDSEPGGENTVSLGGRDYMLAPHGLGVRTVGERRVSIAADHVAVGCRDRFGERDTLRGAGVVEVRPLAEDTIERVLERCPGSVVGRLEQQDAYYRNRATQGDESV